MQRLEDSIAVLDQQQHSAVIETVNGVQRIRGLAGSGKTIVLALKAAYLHAQNPHWKIAVTFHTRSLKGYFYRLINNFVIEQIGQEPRWDQLRIVNSWGAPGSSERWGIYYEFCRENDIEYLDFYKAKQRYGTTRAFDGAVRAALDKVGDPRHLYDAILIDEAQDLPASFLRMCYEVLKPPKRLVYAYDELQNLTDSSTLPPEDIFGEEGGRPRVEFTDIGGSLSPKQDIILEKCYRNSRPLLVTAHGLGFGIYRKHLGRYSSGLVQMFDHPHLWLEIGYRVAGGTLELGSDVTLRRTAETSPLFLEEHSPVDDLIKLQTFTNETMQAAWVAGAIRDNLSKDELGLEDIIVISPNPTTARRKLGVVRDALLALGIPNHHAGVTTQPDHFWQPDSIACTGIYRAKGNEAAMVYVVNADECHTTGNVNASRLRNILFTAITRSKAWVRITGVGLGMDVLAQEYERIRSADFRLSFRYPTTSELEAITRVHRDMSSSERQGIELNRQNMARFVEDIERNRYYIEDFDQDLLEALRRILYKAEEENGF